MLSALQVYDEYIALPIRNRCVLKKVAPHLSKNVSVLDIGSGDGKLAYTLANQRNIKSIVGVDIVLQPHQYIPTTHYDGKRLPFKSKSFDTVLLIDVLHHSLTPGQILEEAKRVARKSIIIKDHFYENRLDFLGLKIADYLGNKPYDISLPYNYFTVSQWEDIFAKYELRCKYSERFRFFPGDIARHIVFVLRN